MSAPVLTFFNNKNGVGKTSLVYHLAWMYAGLGKRTVVVDFDPQAALTTAFLDDERLYDIWNASQTGATVFQCVKPLADGGGIARPVLQPVAEDLWLLPGDIALSGFEERMASEWLGGMGESGLHRPMKMLAAFWQVMRMAAEDREADIVLVDVGPNLSAINRAVLLASDYFAVPLGTDLVSLQALSNLGAAVRSWRSLWKTMADNRAGHDESGRYADSRLPSGNMQPIGYFCQQYTLLLTRPIVAYDKWAKRIPDVFREDILGEPVVEGLTPDTDPYCMALIKHFRSLIPMGQEHRKPIFKLTPADGAIGAHAGAVRDAYSDFKRLAEKIAEKMGVPVEG